MNRDWVKGWNGGLTGPNTPSTPTVAQSCAEHDRYKVLDTWKSGQPYPESISCTDYYIPIACGSDTVAIAVGPDREATADLIVRAPQLERDRDNAYAALAVITSERNMLFEALSKIQDITQEAI